MDMDFDIELETKISHTELHVLLLRRFTLGAKATYAEQWARMCSLSIQCNIGSIGSRTVTSNLTIFLIPEDH